jgi:hypothetical protein
MAPIERRLECLLALQHRTSATGQQPEAVVELTGDLLEREVAAAGSGQLDRQRNAIESGADPSDRTRGVVGE